MPCDAELEAFQQRWREGCDRNKFIWDVIGAHFRRVVQGARGDEFLVALLGRDGMRITAAECDYVIHALEGLKHKH